MNHLVEQTKLVLNKAYDFLKESPWNSEYSSIIKQLLGEVEQPCVLAVAGRVKAGKSSFINALLGRDLAKTGVTETTATINLFKYGYPPDEDKPVCCVWTNGRRTWEEKKFLDSLQGHCSEVFQLAEGISHLEYYIPDPILQSVTLVDTPGTDAIVGEDDDAHQAVTENFFRLRGRHSKETVEQVEHADAVIYLVGQVAMISGQSFLQEFQKVTTGMSSAINAIGVMAKIDMSDSIVEQRHELASAIADKLQHELNTVIPVSAAIWRAVEKLKKENCLADMQEKFKKIPVKAFNQMIKTEAAFFRDSSFLSKIFKIEGETSIPDIETRRELKGEMPWRVFVIIASHLYNYSLVEAEQRLIEISGMKNIKHLLEKHFYQRGKLLRCYRVVSRLRTIFREIEINGLYELNQKAKLKKHMENYVLSHPGRGSITKIADELLSLISCNIKNESEVSQLLKTIKEELIPSVEKLELQLKKSDIKFHALQLIESSPSEFTDEETKELCMLFDKYGTNANILSSETYCRRQQYWNLEYNLSTSRIRREVAECAINCYGSI